MEDVNSKSLRLHQLVTPKCLKIAQFLASTVSVFSLIYCSQYSSWCCFILHSLKFYLSAIPLHALDKRWIFLICNGILVVLASTSGWVSSPSPPNGFDLNHDQPMVRNEFAGYYQHVTPEETTDEEGQVQLVVLHAASGHTGKEELDQTEEEEGEENENDHHETKEEAEEGRQVDEYLEEEQRGDNLFLIDRERLEAAEGSTGEHDHEAGADEEDDLEADADEEDNDRGADADEEDVDREVNADEEDNVEDGDDDQTSFLLEEESLSHERAMLEKLSAEELNKKFEDFIRKMKEELRIEARQQLVLVK